MAIHTTAKRKSSSPRRRSGMNCRHAAGYGPIHRRNERRAPDLGPALVGDTAKVHRVKFQEPRFVARPYLAVVGGLQPALLPELLTHEHRRRAGGAREVVDDGFIDRVLFFCPEPKVPGWSDVSVPDKLRRHYHQLIGRPYGLEPETRGGQLRGHPFWPRGWRPCQWPCAG